MWYADGRPLFAGSKEALKLTDEGTTLWLSLRIMAQQKKTKILPGVASRHDEYHDKWQKEWSAQGFILNGSTFNAHGNSRQEIKI